MPAEDQRVLAWVNRQLARAKAPLLAVLPPGGAPAALPHIDFRASHATAWDAAGQLVVLDLPDHVIHHLRSLADAAGHAEPHQPGER